MSYFLIVLMLCEAVCLCTGDAAPHLYHLERAIGEHVDQHGRLFQGRARYHTDASESSSELRAADDGCGLHHKLAKKGQTALYAETLDALSETHRPSIGFSLGFEF